MGGAAGHMRHPFDLMSVKSGQDLINIFLDLEVLVNEQGSDLPNVKFDGMNTSFKVLKNGRLGVDRSSYADIAGITADNVLQRFPKEGHKMRVAIPIVLSIMEKAGIEQELRALGLYDNPHYFLNTEYAESGTINATKYDGNYIFIHGVNAFYEASHRGMVRPGLKKPLSYNPKKGMDMPTKDKSVEVPYDKEALASLVAKANTVAQTLSPPFSVVGPVPVRNISDIDYTSALAEPMTIPVSETYLQSDPALRSLQGSSLESWLKAIKKKPAQYYAPLYDVTIPTLEGKDINPYHKNTYLRIYRDGTFVDEIVPDEHVRTLIDGVILLHATRKLGDAFLQGLTSDFGNLINPEGDNHEGVVIRNERFSTYPFKITGEFIVDGMFSNFSQQNENTVPMKKSQLKKLIESLVISF